MIDFCVALLRRSRSQRKKKNRPQDFVGCLGADRGHLKETGKRKGGEEVGGKEEVKATDGEGKRKEGEEGGNKEVKATDGHFKETGKRKEGEEKGKKEVKATDAKEKRKEGEEEGNKEVKATDGEVKRKEGEEEGKKEVKVTDGHSKVTGNRKEEGRKSVKASLVTGRRGRNHQGRRRTMAVHDHESKCISYINDWDVEPQTLRRSWQGVDTARPRQPRMAKSNDQLIKELVQTSRLIVKVGVLLVRVYLYF